jgi:hypothetical protein
LLRQTTFRNPLNLNNNDIIFVDNWGQRQRQSSLCLPAGQVFASFVAAQQKAQLSITAQSPKVQHPTCVSMGSF